MSGFIFLCDNNTESECLQRLLFGTNSNQIYAQAFKNIKIGDLCCLYNYETASLKGIYRALTPCQKNIEPNAWSDSKIKFPYQVRVSTESEYETPLSLQELQNILHFSYNWKYPVPLSIVPNETLSEILSAFKKRNNDFRPFEARYEESKSLTNSYIFKCDKVTGGKCFSDNVMGAPVFVFKDIVSKIQPGSLIFVWQIEERRLYGVWRALSRGQYDPLAFESRFPAVVICERQYNLDKGISEEKLRGIVPFDQSMPPYVINHKKGHDLIEALINENSNQSDYIEKAKIEHGRYVTEDGHIVRSLSEAFIDNWLFNHNLPHAYEYRVQLGNKFLKCDFYIPPKKIYIEFWGLIGKREYDDRRKVKKAIYKSAGVKLLEIFPNDIPVLSEVLQAKLASYGISVL
jgi:hypothetical protein